MSCLLPPYLKKGKNYVQDLILCVEKEVNRMPPCCSLPPVYYRTPQNLDKCPEKASLPHSSGDTFSG